MLGHEVLLRGGGKLEVVSRAWCTHCCCWSTNSKLVFVVPFYNWSIVVPSYSSRLPRSSRYCSSKPQPTPWSQVLPLPLRAHMLS